MLNSNTSYCSRNNEPQFVTALNVFSFEKLSQPFFIVNSIFDAYCVKQLSKLICWMPNLCRIRGATSIIDFMSLTVCRAFTPELSAVNPWHILCLTTELLVICWTPNLCYSRNYIMDFESVIGCCFCSLQWLDLWCIISFCSNLLPVCWTPTLCHIGRDFLRTLDWSVTHVVLLCRKTYW